MANIKFYPHKDKGEGKVYLRLKIGAKKDFRLSSGLTIKDSTKWSKTTNYPTTSSSHNKNLKKRLSKLKVEIEDYIYDIENDQDKSVLDIQSIDIKKVIQKFNNSEPLTNKDLLIPFTEWYCKDLKTRTYLKNNVKFKYKQNTIDKYLNFKKVLKAYQKHKGKVLKLKDVDNAFADDFLNYLTDTNPKSINTKGRFIKRLKTIVRDAQINNCSVNPEYLNIKGFEDESIVTFLTFDEIELIIKKEMPTERLAIAKDWFIIACYTAQRVSDLHRFTKKNIQIIDGGLYIVTKQFKTGKSIEIPVHYKVANVLNKYGNNFPPKFSENEQSQRSTLSSLIKKVCSTSGIREKVEGRYNGKKGTYPKYKLISNHTGRRSFACNFYNLGNWSTQEIMNITGHVNERNFYAYIDKSDRTLSKMARSKFDAMEVKDKEPKEPQLSIVKDATNN